jgi:hypothetical protein
MFDVGYSPPNTSRGEWPSSTHVEDSYRLGTELRAGCAEVPGANRSQRAIGGQLIQKQSTVFAASAVR